MYDQLHCDRCATPAICEVAIDNSLVKTNNMVPLRKYFPPRVIAVGTALLVALTTASPSFANAQNNATFDDRITTAAKAATNGATNPIDSSDMTFDLRVTLAAKAAERAVPERDLLAYWARIARR